jgi:hypothetical protein
MVQHGSTRVHAWLSRVQRGLFDDGRIHFLIRSSD